MLIDRLIIEFDKVLRTLATPALASRPTPAEGQPYGELSEAEKKHASALMRINHVGEICAQALYQGQSITSRDPALAKSLIHASVEETDHLAWTAGRLHELGGRTSLLNPLWYLGSLGIGTLAGLAGDKWSLGFLAATEEQVQTHLQSHIDQWPAQDAPSLAILTQMKSDEASHAQTAINLGAAPLPAPIKAMMKLSAKVMTRTAYWV